MNKNVRDLSHTKGTYTKVIQDNLQEIYANVEKMDTADFKSYILRLMDQAADTPARANFIANINKQRNKVGLIMLVNNAWLRGQGLGANINDKFAR